MQKYRSEIKGNLYCTYLCKELRPQSKIWRLILHNLYNFRIFKFLGAFAKLRKGLLASSYLSVHTSARVEKLGSHLTDFQGILHLRYISKIYRENSTFINMTIITSILYEDLFTHVIMSRWILLMIRNVSDENCRVKSKHKFYVQYNFSEIARFMR